MKREWILFLALVVFFVFGILAVDFLIEPKELQPNKQKEGFTAGPTRVSDCRCLPNYIPSNTIPGTPNGGSVIRYNQVIFFVPVNTKDAYYVPRCQMCNMNFCNKGVYQDVNETTFKQYKNKGELQTCDLVEQGKKEKVLETYFCQKVGNATKTMSCY